MKLQVHRPAAEISPTKQKIRFSGRKGKERRDVVARLMGFSANFNARSEEIHHRFRKKELRRGYEQHTQPPYKDDRWEIEDRPGNLTFRAQEDNRYCFG